jgi:murein DD-endopeptidase MepM/ murein hydrolase activator NlpD
MVMKKSKIIIISLICISFTLVLINIFYYVSLKKSINFYNSFKHDDEDLRNKINLLINENKISKKNIINYLDAINYFPYGKPFLNDYNIIQVFGLYISKKQKLLSGNNGVVFESIMGAKIISTADGTVKEVKKVSNNDQEYDTRDYIFKGYTVEIRHKDFITRYTNLNEVFLKQGDKVKRGDVIGKLDYSENPKLHYIIKNFRNYVDPLPFINYFE